MPASKPDLQARLEALRSRLKGADVHGGTLSSVASTSASASNALLRELSCEAELLKMDLVELAGGEKVVFKGEVEDAELGKMLSDVGQLTQPLRLRQRHNAMGSGGISALVAKGAMALRVIVMFFTVLGGSLNILLLVWLRLTHPILRRLGVPVNWLPMDFVQTLFGRMCLVAAGVEVEVQGAEHMRPPAMTRPSILMYSHGSNLDPFIIQAVAPVLSKWVAKESVMLIPGLGWALYALGNLPISRKNTKKAIKSLHKLQEHVGRGRSLAIAPEGTRSKTGLLGDFKKGAFHMQYDTKLAASPVVIFGAYELWPPSQPFTLPGQVVVRFCRQRQPAAGDDRDQSRHALRRFFLQELARDPPAHAGAALTWAQVARLAAGYIVLYAYLKGTWAMAGWALRALRWSGAQCFAAAVAFELFIFVKEVLL